MIAVILGVLMAREILIIGTGLVFIALFVAFATRQILGYRDNSFISSTFSNISLCLPPLAFLWIGYNFVNWIEYDTNARSEVIAFYDKLNDTSDSTLITWQYGAKTFSGTDPGRGRIISGDQECLFEITKLKGEDQRIGFEHGRCQPLADAYVPPGLNFSEED